MPLIPDVLRIARKPDPWVLPDWRYASPDSTFGCRYDDPNGEYRVLYAASQRLSCFLEVLAVFRLAPEVAIGLAQIDGPDDFDYPPGTVPPDFLDNRLIGTAAFDVRVVPICDSQWLAWLRPRLSPYLLNQKIRTFDISTLISNSPRRVTQLASRFIFEGGYTGIVYPSRHGLDLENWAFFEPVNISGQRDEEISYTDIDLQKALELHSLVLGD